MKIFLRALNQIYQFFAGDLILLGAIALAFGSSALFQNQSNILRGLLFVGLIVAGLIAALMREALSKRSSNK